MTRDAGLLDATIRWNAIVIGSGPAGSTAAMCLASAGLSTLLLERAKFPRPKVCGGCLSPAGVALVQRLGVRVAMAPTQGLKLWSGGLDSMVRTHPGYVVERGAFDEAMACRATALGVACIDACSARVLSEDVSGSRVLAHCEGQSRELNADVVVCADGLHGRSLDGLPGMESTVWSRSRIGLGVVVDPSTIPREAQQALDADAMIMMVAPRGYVGFARLHDGRWDIASAIDPALVAASGGPGEAIASIVRSASRCESLASCLARVLHWKGTPLLTRQRLRVESGSVFVAGDAAGYAEPFTGEGMTWAIRSGMRAASCALAMVRGEHRAGAYEAWYAGNVRSQHRRAMRVARVLRVAGLVGAGVRCARGHILAGRFLARVAGSWGTGPGASPAQAGDPA